MDEFEEKPGKGLPLIRLVPNMMTIAAICAGISAIRFGAQGRFELAVQLVLLAAVLDGLDGRLARLMKSDSDMGAELDSLADFLNFGVVPPLLLHFWSLHDMRALGWLAVLAFAVCAVLRLSRFNVAEKTGGQPDKAFFQGVPAPAGALLAMLPMYISFAFGGLMVPDAVTALTLLVVGFLMISTIPTYSFKTTRIAREKVRFLLVGAALLAASLLTMPWETLILLCLLYTGMVIWALIDPPTPSPDA